MTNYKHILSCNTYGSYTDVKTPVGEFWLNGMGSYTAGGHGLPYRTFSSKDEVFSFIDEYVEKLLTRREQEKNIFAVYQQEVVWAEEQAQQARALVYDKEKVANDAKSKLAVAIAASRGLPDTHVYELGSMWDCGPSPVNKCLYDLTSKHQKDYCVLCHDPRVRK